MTFPISEGTEGQPPSIDSDLLPRPWIVETSQERIGQPWRAEDHAALLQHLEAVDQLLLAWFQRYGPTNEGSLQDGLETFFR